MNIADHAQTIRNEALRMGFTICGFTAVSELTTEGKRYKEWLEHERWGKMEYLKKNYKLRLDPREVMPEARSVITLGVSYNPKEIIPQEDNFIISRYAYGKDYHVVIRDLLDNLVERLKKIYPGILCQRFIDSGVLLEKAWAQRAGLGWQGKNTLLINKHYGSFLFIGIILTDLEIDPDPPHADHCGSCSRCLDACPTGALEQPYVLNPLKCISYHNIEVKDEIPAEIRERMGDRIYGCDICQEVCPFNRHAPALTLSALDPSPGLAGMRKADWIVLSEEGFNKIFRESAVRRRGYRKLMQTIRSLLPSDTNRS